ncbi:MAG: hypothetical protein K0S65_4632, partial [Labilithrix sp.]|nr:hypothetical protein [Labilithrix sp.]
MTTIDPGARDEELPNDVLIQRARDRLRNLISKDPDLQHAVPSLPAIQEIMKCPTTIESVAKAFELYADRPCFAERAIEPTSDGGERLLPRFRAVRYADIWARVEAFASGLLHDKLVETGSFVGICGFGSTDWVVADLGCIYLAAVSAPLQTGMSPTDLKQIIQETELSCIICSFEQLESIEAVLPECPSLKSLVVMDVRDDEAAEAVVAGHATSSLRVQTMRATERRGRKIGIVPKVLPSARNEADPLMTLFYTSGSTGTPKGAMVPESLLRAQWQAGFFLRLLHLMPEFPYVIVNYMPLNHGAGRGSVTHSIVRGGLTYFVAKSDMSTLFEDIRLARPTTMMLVPRVSGMIYQHFQSEVVRRSEGVSDEKERSRIADEIMAEMRDTFLGDRLLWVIISTAPTPPEVMTFLKRCFGVPVVDGYGSTEAGPMTFDNHVDPSAGLEWKLVDVPELGYRRTDKPYPRGELHVRSRFLVPGYYKNEKATKDLFDTEGMLNTG